MTDKLEFKLIDPIEKCEEWADPSDEKIRAVEIYINGREIVDILKELEMPFADEEGHPTLAGAYGHRIPKELYNVLSESLIENSYEWEYGAEVLCCNDCGFPGCWSATVKIRQDEKFVYWENFEQNHRKNWKYDLSFKFDKNEYEKEFEKLKSFAEDFDYSMF